MLFFLFKNSDLKKEFVMQFLFLLTHIYFQIFIFFNN